MNAVRVQSGILEEEIPYVERLLNNVNNFREIILIEVNLLEFGTILEFLLECDESPLEAEEPAEQGIRIRMLRFINVQELQYKTPVLDDFSMRQKSWEMGELEYIRLKNDPNFLVRFGPMALLFNHVEVGWKNKRAMDVVFSGLELI